MYNNILLIPVSTSKRKELPLNRQALFFQCGETGIRTLDEFYPMPR